MSNKGKYALINTKTAAILLSSGLFIRTEWTDIPIIPITRTHCIMIKHIRDVSPDLK
jgi:hypothetical protein